MANKRRKMYLRMVTSSLIRRASRLIIAVLAIAIGATILSGLVTIYYDIPRQLTRIPFLRRKPAAAAQGRRQDPPR